MIIAPTWRIVPDARRLRRATQKREVRDVYLGLGLRAGLARDPALARRSRRRSRRRGCRLGFMPHPNMQAGPRARCDLPAPRRAPSRSTARTSRPVRARALLVTDYSSVAFNAAYLDRPVVYYQFDRDDVVRGRAPRRKGYFDYERDGFGPVARTHDEAIAAIVAVHRGRRAARPRSTRSESTARSSTATGARASASSRRSRSCSRPYRTPSAARPAAPAREP